jgi:hypothetical protein
VREEQDNMSLERPDQRTRQGNPTEYQIPNAPDHAPEYTERVDNFDTSDADAIQRRRRLLIGLGTPAAAFALAAGLFVGNKLLGGNGDGDPSKAGQRPIATAPATPGETHPATSATTPATQETAPGAKLDLQTVPITVTIGGEIKTFTGVDAAAEALHSRLEGHTPAEVKNIVMTEIIPAVLNMSSDPNVWKAASGYESSDGSLTGEAAAASDGTQDLLAKALTGKTYAELSGSANLSEQSTSASLSMLDGIASKVALANMSITSTNPRATTLMRVAIKPTGNPDVYQLTDNSAQIPRSEDPSNLVGSVAQPLQGFNIVTAKSDDAYLNISSN